MHHLIRTENEALNCQFPTDEHMNFQEESS